jgi:hypothetical protein
MGPTPTKKYPPPQKHKTFSLSHCSTCSTLLSRLFDHLSFFFSPNYCSSYLPARYFNPGLDPRCPYTRQWCYRSIFVTSRCDFNNSRPAFASPVRSPSACRSDHDRFTYLAHHGSLTILPAPSPPLPAPLSPQVAIAATVVRLPLVDDPRNPAVAYSSPFLFLYAVKDSQ